MQPDSHQDDRILLVEDNEVLREMIAAQLLALGLAVKSVPNGKEALSELATGRQCHLH